MISDVDKAGRFDEVIYHADELILEVEKFLSGYRITLQREIYSKYEFYDAGGGYQEETDFIESDFSDYSCEDIYICRDLLGEADYLETISEYLATLSIGRLAHAVTSWYVAKEEGNLVEMMFLSTFMYFYMGRIKNTSEIEEAFAKKFKSDFAKNNASKRHAETYQLKSEVIKHWSENIDSTLSNEKAAELLKKHFPLSHRKLSEYVSEAKRTRGDDHARK